MPKLFCIKLDVEEIALGSVLNRLNDLDLGTGGHGGGAKQLAAQAASLRSSAKANEQAAVKLLMHGPKHIKQISAALGGNKTRAYGAMNTLRKKGLTEAAAGRGMHQLTALARAQLGAALPALPPPAGKRGRAARGSGNIVMRAALDAGPVSPGDLRKHMQSKGMSPKSVAGVLERAKKRGLIKRNGVGYELTAKGQKMEAGGAHNA
jgi:DNA-binding PadR family transcriptional regulator